MQYNTYLGVQVHQAVLRQHAILAAGHDLQGREEDGHNYWRCAQGNFGSGGHISPTLMLRAHAPFHLKVQFETV